MENKIIILNEKLNSRVHQSLLGEKKNIKDKTFPLVSVWVRQQEAWKLHPYNFGI